MKLLLVDDNGRSAANLTAGLQAEGLSVVHVESADEGFLQATETAST